LLEEKGVDLPMQPRNPIASLRGAWRGKGLVRASLLLLAAALIAAAASAFGIAHDYGYLHASILTGSPGGHYHALTMRLAERAKREHGTLIVVATAGSIENVNRLTSAARGGCAEKFALVQDGTPVPVNARLELLGRLPEPESLLLLGRPGHAFRSFADVRGASIGIGPEGSGTAYLMRQLFEDPDLQELEVHLSHYGLLEQAELVAQSKLDLAAFVIQEDAEFLRTIIRRHGLDIVSPQDLQGLIARSRGSVLAAFQPAATTWCARSRQWTNKLRASELWLSPVRARSEPTGSRYSYCLGRSCRASCAAILQVPQAPLPCCRSHPRRINSSLPESLNSLIDTSHG
jgi:hypothetical protein